MTIFNTSTNVLNLTDLSSFTVIAVPPQTSSDFSVTNVFVLPDSQQVSGRDVCSWNGTAAVVLQQPSIDDSVLTFFQQGLISGSMLAAILFGFIAVRRALSLGDAWDD